MKARGAGDMDGMPSLLKAVSQGKERQYIAGGAEARDQYIQLSASRIQ